MVRIRYLACVKGVDGETYILSIYNYILKYPLLVNFGNFKISMYSVFTRYIGKRVSICTYILLVPIL